MSIKYFSLFSGIGGFELGIGKKGQCVGFSEIDKHAISIYQSHFPKHKNYGDITKINTNELPDFDLLCGGFPCQSFSIAGKRQGFNDTRGTLFFEIARIIRAKQPRLLLLENVKGLLSHDQGRTFRTILSTLDELGYDCGWQVLNSKNFGVPQNRERVYIVGYLRGASRPKVFPIAGKANQNTTESKSAKTAVARTLTAGGNSGGNHSGMTILRIPEATKKGYAEASTGDSINLAVPSSITRRGRVGKGIAQTLDTGMQQYTISKTIRSGGRSSPHGSKQNWDSYNVNGAIRRLTPTECERLQGFPDGWTKGVSDTQRYKTLGNAVTANVVRFIINCLN